MRWVLLVLLGCRAHTPATDAIDTPVLYQAEFVGVFGPIESERTGEVFQSEMEVKMQLRLRVEPTRAFRDGSYGRNIYIDSVSVQTGSDAQPIATQLRGRSVELRTFPDGEILDIAWSDKVAGDGRYLDVFEMVYPAVSPSAPTISEGDIIKQRIIWPFRIENSMRWDNIVDAIWRNHGKSEVTGGETWLLSYEGAWGTEGKTRRMLPKQEWKGRGAAKGDVHFDKKTSDLVRHSMNWSRVVSVRGEGGVLIQRQEFTGSMERVR